MGQSTVSMRRRSEPSEPVMSLPTGLSQRGGVWQLRIGVPADLRHLYPGIDAYRGSLRTRDRSEAITKAHVLHAQYRQTFDLQRATEAVRRAPPNVPLTPEIEAYLIAEAEWLPLIFDDVVRFTPGAVEALTPGVRFLSANDTTAPLLTGNNPAKWDKLQQHALDAAKADLAAGRLERLQRAADTALQGLGVRIDWTDSKARLALARVGRAQVRAYRQTLERGQGEPHDTPAKPVPPVLAEVPGAVEPAKGHNLAAVFKAWQEGKKRDAINKTRRAMALAEAAGITSPIEALTRQDGLKFRDHINTKMAGTSGKTRSDVLASVQALLNFAVKEKGWIDANPWAGTAIAKGRAQKREPWDNEALTKLLHAPLAEDRRLDMAAQYWLPLLALMTGARQAELCQLRIDDVIQRDGVWLLDINEDDADKSVKSAAGERWVAIHSKLIALGFIDHVEAMRSAGQSLVFPGILKAESRSAALYVSDWFRARCKALGLYQRWRDFHALRTTVPEAQEAFHAGRLDASPSSRCELRQPVGGPNFGT